jgi:hypothetical protein
MAIVMYMLTSALDGLRRKSAKAIQQSAAMGKHGALKECAYLSVMAICAKSVNRQARLHQRTQSITSSTKLTVAQIRKIIYKQSVNHVTKLKHRTNQK